MLKFLNSEVEKNFDKMARHHCDWFIFTSRDIYEWIFENRIYECDFDYDTGDFIITNATLQEFADLSFGDYKVGE